MDSHGEDALFSLPLDIALDASGDLYVADSGNERIRRIAPDGTVTTLAGSESGFVDGPATTARFFAPTGLALDGSGGLFVCEAGNHTIRRVDLTTGEVTTLAGGLPGYQDGPLADARFQQPNGLVVDRASNTLCVADTWNNAIRRVDLGTRRVETLAGGAVSGSRDGSGLEARFFHPVRLALDETGGMYVSDSENNRIRHVSASGDVTTVAGGSVGYEEGTGSAARFARPSGLALAQDGTLFLSDRLNHVIRSVTPDGTTSLVAGRPGVQGPSPDGDAGEVALVAPFGLVMGADGQLFFTQQHEVSAIER